MLLRCHKRTCHYDVTRGHVTTMSQEDMSQEDTVSVTTAQVQPLVMNVTFVRYFRVNPRIDRGNDTSKEVAECTGKSSICPRE